MLIDCKDCGAKVSHISKECLKCGRPIAFRSRYFYFGIFAILVFGFLFREIGLALGLQLILFGLLALMAMPIMQIIIHGGGHLHIKAGFSKFFQNSPTLRDGGKIFAQGAWELVSSFIGLYIAGWIFASTLTGEFASANYFDVFLAFIDTLREVTQEKLR